MAASELDATLRSHVDRLVSEFESRCAVTSYPSLASARRSFAAKGVPKP